MGQSTLHTGRIRLVPLSDEHLEHEVNLDSDPEVMRYLGNGRAHSRGKVERLHQARLAAAPRVPELGFWAGFIDSGFVGCWILGPAERTGQGPVDGQAELGYRILHRHWRKGLASEGARELLRHGFEDLGLTLIFAETMAVNAGSRATLTAIGMQHVRTFHTDNLPAGDERRVAGLDPGGAFPWVIWLFCSHLIGGCTPCPTYGSLVWRSRRDYDNGWGSCPARRPANGNPTGRVLRDKVA